MHELIGRTIAKININDDSRCIHFALDDGDLVYIGWGDCCACVYFEDIEYPYSATGSYKVIGARQAKDYGNILITDKGLITISGRYYDGSGFGGYSAGIALADKELTEKLLQEDTWKEFISDKK